MNELRIAVIGRTGQLARALKNEGEKEGYKIDLFGREFLDLSSPAADIEAFIEALPSETNAVVIAAAYTAVDAAEDSPDLAFSVNATAPGAIAKACASLSIPVVHVSTDYVFAGNASRPYKVDDQTNPLGVYGNSKREGELSVLKSGANAIILRTSWVFDGVGKNFFTTMLRLGQNTELLRVVNDQIGRPTYAGLLAQACLTATKALCDGKDMSEHRIFHVSATGVPISWADFAEAIFEKASLQNKVTVEHIPSIDYPTAAKRPVFSILETSAFEKCFDMVLPDWTQGLELAMTEYKQNLLVNSGISHCEKA